MIKNGKEYVLESSEEAVELHLEMWRDMQNDLGDTPSPNARRCYKEKWLMRKGYAEVFGNCFLCEFDKQVRLYVHNNCHYCPIDWTSLSNSLPSGRCVSTYKNGEDEIYLCAPISEILALPVKGEKHDARNKTLSYI